MSSLPSSKVLSTPRPLAGKGLFLGVSPFVPLNMFHAPNTEGNVSQYATLVRSQVERYRPEAFATVLARQRLGLLLPGFPILVGSGWGGSFDGL